MTGQESKAKLFAETILKVRNGELSAKKAATALGMSRKTYYKWEKRGLRGMLDALAEKPSGRPEAPPEDPEKLALKKDKERLETENLLLKKQLELREMAHRMQIEDLEAEKK